MGYRLSFKQYHIWYNKVQQRIDELNEISEFTTLHFYQLGFRGKNKKLCLIRNGDEVLACGINQITHIIQFLRSGRKLFED